MANTSQILVRNPVGDFLVAGWPTGIPIQTLFVKELWCHVIQNCWQFYSTPPNILLGGISWLCCCVLVVLLTYVSCGTRFNIGFNCSSEKGIPLLELQSTAQMSTWGIWTTSLETEYIISRRSLQGREWIPRSPDLSPLDFCLSGYLKSKVYSPRPATLNQLQAIITREVASQQGEATLRSRPVIINFLSEKFAVDSLHMYSLVHLVRPKLEELISRAFLGLFKIRLLFQDRVRSQNFRF